MGEDLYRHHAGEQSPCVPFILPFTESCAVAVCVTPADVGIYAGEVVINGTGANQKHLLCGQTSPASDGDIVGKEEGERLVRRELIGGLGWELINPVRVSLQPLALISSLTRVSGIDIPRQISRAQIPEAEGVPEVPTGVVGYIVKVAQHPFGKERNGVSSTIALHPLLNGGNVSKPLRVS